MPAGLPAAAVSAGRCAGHSRDTDGIDGSEDSAGALYGPDSIARARALLENNDGYGFSSALGDLVVSGPTRTNVNDFRAILIL